MAATPRCPSHLLSPFLSALLIVALMATLSLSAAIRPPARGGSCSFGHTRRLSLRQMLVDDRVSSTDSLLAAMLTSEEPARHDLPPGLVVQDRALPPPVTDPTYVESIVEATEEPLVGVEMGEAEGEAGNIMGGGSSGGGSATLSTVTPSATPVYVHISQIGPMMDLKSVWGKFIDLSSWSATIPCASWFLVKCWTTGYIRRMELSKQNIFATLPAAIGELKELEEFMANTNWIYGAIPESFGNLVKLKNLQLYQNYLNVSLPASMGNMRSLYQLHLNLNYLQGGIPDTFSKLTNMQKFYVPNNLLTGPFPTVVCTMTALRQLRLSYNHFYGSVPACVSRLQELYYMYIDTNWLNGTLPSALGNMPKLQNLFFNQNSLRGPLPASLTKLTKLRILFMSSNPYLDGPLPPKLGNMGSLTDFIMEFAAFSGTIPDSITKLTRLSRILLDNNKFKGSIPVGIGKLTDLTVFYLEGNKFFGTIPKGLLALPKLNLVNLHNNQFSGPLPIGFRNGTVLSGGQYNLHHNFFSGLATVTAGGVTACPKDETRRGIFYQSSLAFNCLSYPETSACYKAGRVEKQVDAATCLRFCNAAVNVCGGHGSCWFGDGHPVGCDCYKGYVRSADNKTCLKSSRVSQPPKKPPPKRCSIFGCF